MKILTKPEKFRTAFPSIYGYEDDGGGSWVFEPPRDVARIYFINEEGQEVLLETHYTHHYNCEAGGNQCKIGDTFSWTFVIEA